MDERKHAAHICLTLPAIYVTMAVEWMERAEKNKMTKYEVLKKYFGYDSFREGQEMLVDALLSGQDVLGIMPTGAGKSLCYQIPALLLPGITLVVSPLISLMKDQVSTLNQAGIHAAFLNSSLSAVQYRKALGFAMEGRYKIIYVAPERLLTPEFLCAVQSMEISMISVDEAHCISQWGQDFRPSYLKITEFVEQLPARPVIGAFTATATKEVRDDIEALLSLRDPVRLVTGFDRKNLKFTVQQPKDKFAAVESFLAEHEADCGIIYCLTRKNVEEVCEKLEQKGYSVTRYHAGLSDLERKENQEDFIYDRKQIMVATNAFGMGIDKSNVRYVIHYNMPKNMESYYQEAGRAGRDGLPAECILLYAGQDVITNQFFIENMAQESEDPETTALIRQREEERLKKMTFYCFTHECLRDYILRYFGEYGSNYCGNCSNCLSEFETVDVTAAAKAILGCVRECRQRYGTTVILDTLHGANTAKIRQYRMDENTHYGELAKEPVYRLRQILNELQVREYLYVTADTYSIVRLLPKAAELLDEDGTMLMKMAKEEKRIPKAAKEKTKTKTSAAAKNLSNEETAVFEKLRALRMELAKEHKVPPYIIFSDKTLIQMAMEKPSNKEEMLAVSGVGESKFEKYGEPFLACLAER